MVKSKFWRRVRDARRLIPVAVHEMKETRARHSDVQCGRLLCITNGPPTHYGIPATLAFESTGNYHHMWLTFKSNAGCAPGGVFSPDAQIFTIRAEAHPQPDTPPSGPCWWPRMRDLRPRLGRDRDMPNCLVAVPSPCPSSVVPDLYEHFRDQGVSEVRSLS